jgi:uncharacterized small protein (DUF1192 family)
LINQIYHKLKDLNDSEIKTRKAIRDNNHSVILSEVNKQGRILGNIDYLLKIKSLRVGELNKARAGIFKQEIKRLTTERDNLTKEHNRHISSLKNEDRQHIQYLNRHHEEKRNRYNAAINNLKKLLDESEKLRNDMRHDCKTSIQDTQRVMYNI